jgi:predicted RNA polymerase sigma factor
MAPTKVHDHELRAFLDAGHTQAQAARHFGVSEPAIHQRLKRMKTLTSRVVALERAGVAVTEGQASATDRLERVQRIIDGQLTWAEGQTKCEGADRMALADVILKLTGEVRQQLALQLSITRALVDLREVRDFQKTVQEVIESVDPDVAQRIVARLKERRALRPSAELLPALGGTGQGYGDALA